MTNVITIEKRKGCAQTIAALFAVVAVGRVSAIDVRLTADDTSTQSSFANVGNWNPAVVPQSGYDFFTDGHVLATPNGAEITFQGDSLTVDNKVWHINAKKTTIPALFAKEGGYFYSVNKKGPIEGCLTLDSGVGFKWQDAGTSQTDPNELNMDIVGDATTSVYHERKSGTVSKGLRLAGNLSAFYGTVYSHQTNIVMQVVFGAGKTSCPGKLECTNGARLEIEVADGIAATVGSIDATDVKVTLGEGATLTVSGEVDLHGNPIRVVSAHVFTASAETVSFVTFTTATLAVSDVVLEDVKVAAETGLSHCPSALNLQPDVSGGTFSLSHRRVVYQTTSDTRNVSSIFTGPEEERWSETLSAEKAAETDYYLSQKTAYHPLTTPVSFYGKSLTLVGGGTDKDMVSGFLSTVASRTLTIDDFRWLANGSDGVQISSYNGDVTLKGAITVLPSARNVFFGWYQWNGNTVKINSDIRGAGGIRLTVNQDAAADANGTYVLAGDNSGFTGRLLLMHKPFKAGTTPASNPDGHFVTVKVSEQRNLGGALASFDAESLSIEDNSLLMVTQSATFDEPTRGWQVRGHGRLGVPQDALVVVTNKTVTYVADDADAGRFTKEGAGTLVLGGDAVAEAGSSLEVKAGSLRFASTNAVQGLSVCFAADTTLQVDMSVTGAFAEKGVVNLSATPFGSAAADGKIPLELLASGTMPDTERTVAICTVSDTLKDVLKFDYPSKFNRRAVSVAAVDNHDGTATFFVTVANKGGLCLIFR